jgi:hypothetical protein
MEHQGTGIRTRLGGQVCIWHEDHIKWSGLATSRDQIQSLAQGQFGPGLRSRLTIQNKGLGLDQIQRLGAGANDDNTDLAHDQG